LSVFSLVKRNSEPEPTTAPPDLLFIRPVGLAAASRRLDSSLLDEKWRAHHNDAP
jgi:hypothetical protein